jgi:hypothetical protein
MMDLLAEVPISARHLGRLTEEIGEELRRARDQRSEDWPWRSMALACIPGQQARGRACMSRAGRKKR